MIAALEPTFGAINLEDIKAPDCFYVERELRKRMKIPVFHDDQHGTAITVAAAILNALKVAGKNIGEVKLVTSGAGAAALACLNLLLKVGLKAGERLRDRPGRSGLRGPYRADGRRQAPVHAEDRCASRPKSSRARTCSSACRPAACSSRPWWRQMAPNPVIFALANPNPEITPEDARSVRDDIIMATGRADYPNQVNNVLCFPYIFRGALDAGATTITDEMEIAAVHAIADLAQAEQSERVAAAYVGEKLISVAST